MTLFVFVDHQFAAGGVALFRHFIEGDDDSFAACATVLDESIGDALNDLALLVGGATLQHGDLNHGHNRFSVSSTQYPVLSTQLFKVARVLAKLSTEYRVLRTEY